MSQSSTTSGVEMAEDVESYLSVFAVDSPAYDSIQMSVLASSEFMAFLTVVSGDRVTVVHSLGRFSGGLGKQLLSHQRIFGLIGEKVGGELPPMVMAPMLGIAPFLQIKEVNVPTDAQLGALATTESRTILEPKDADNEDTEVYETASVQKLGYIPREWAAYFLEPITPWEALEKIRGLIATLPEPQQEKFEYLQVWGKAACMRSASNAKGSIL
jgi:hypothetical protein